MNSKSEHKPATKKKNEPDVTYDYRDEQGKGLFQVCRHDLPNEDKNFSQRRPNGKGGFVNNVKGVRLVLYDLPGVLKAQDIFFCEGEKDCNSIKRLGFAATCNPMGAGKIENQQKKHKILDPLKDKNVFILADNDEPGEQHALQIADLVYPIAKSVKIIHFDDLPKHGDVTDFIKQHGDKARTRFIERIAEAPEWTPPKAFYTLNDLNNLPSNNNLPIIDKGIMPWNSHILIAGESGVGKSLLRDELALHIAMGWHWMGFEIPKARKVCVFQWENSEQTEKFRIQKMMKGLNISKEGIGDRLIFANRENHYDLKLKTDRQKLLQAVKESGAEVIIYDCLSNIHSEKENDNVRMRVICDVLSNINAKLKTSCILIHHFGKPGENPLANAYRVRGASSIMDWAYTAMTFTRKPHEDKTLRKIEFIKVRDGRQPKPFYVERDNNTFLCIIYDEDSLVPPDLIYTILNDNFNGSVDKQKDLMQAIMGKTNCSDRTAKQAIRQAVKMSVIYEYGAKNSRSKGHRVPMAL